MREETVPGIVLYLEEAPCVYPRKQEQGLPPYYLAKAENHSLVWSCVHFPLRERVRQLRKGICTRDVNDQLLYLFLSFSSACLMPYVGKLQINKNKKENVSCGLMTSLSKKMSLLYSQLHSRLQFNSLSTSNKSKNNLLQCREIREEKLHCILRPRMTE